MGEVHPPAIIGAYKATQAANAHYPNVGELVASIVGRENIMGVITEIDAEKCAELRLVWPQDKVKVIQNSWRNSTKEFQKPEGLAIPWLIEIDPLSYRMKYRGDDGSLCTDDLSRILSFAKPYLDSTRGTISVVCYCIDQTGMGIHLRNDMKRVFDDYSVDFVQDQLRKGYANIATIISNDHALVKAVKINTDFAFKLAK